MPIHDWTRVFAGLFHHFHHGWISEISRAANESLSGTDYYALAEQITGAVGPDVLTLQRPPNGPAPTDRPQDRGKRGGVALATSPPQLRFRIADEKKWYADKKKAVTIRHVTEHRLVAVLEIVSPGNKSSRSALNAFLRKAQELLTAGIHLSIIDLFPPTPRDPQGIHPLVWEDDDGDTFQFNPDKPLTCAAYIGGLGAEAFVEPIAVGDALPNLPLFLTPEEFLPLPLEATYQVAFDGVPDVWRQTLAAPAT